MSTSQAEINQLKPTSRVSHGEFATARNKVARRNELLEQEVEQLADKVRTFNIWSSSLEDSHGVATTAPKAAIHPSVTGPDTNFVHGGAREPGIAV